MRETSAIPPRELAREALRVFRKLNEARAYLRRLEPPEDAIAGLFVSRNGFRKPVLRVEHRFVEAFLKSDWLLRDEPGLMRLSDAGSAWYRRAMAGSDSFREQHQLRRSRQVEGVPGARITVQANAGESPLGWLRTRRDGAGGPFISDEQFEAGERLRADYERARLSPRVTADWSGATGGARRRKMGARSGDMSLPETAVEAKRRVYKALDAVGPELAAILVEICCNFSGLALAERELGLPQRAGKVVLQIALSQLARHYGMGGTMARVRSPMRHWGADDFRPRIDGDW